MAATESPRGLIVDLATPMQPDGTLDGRSLGRLLDRVVGECQAVFLASPSLGEGPYLTGTMRANLLNQAIVVLRGHKPIMIWITGASPAETLENLQALESVRRRHADGGGTVLYVDAPLFYHSNRGLPALYGTYADVTNGTPFILYNDPELNGCKPTPLKRRNIRTAILKELSRLTAVTGLIFHGSFARAQGYQKAVRARPDFRIYDGNEEHFLDFPSMSGLVSRGANLDPRAWRTITASSLHMDGSSKNYPDFTRQIWQLGSRLRALKTLYDPAPAAVIKAALAAQGVIGSAFCHTPAPQAESNAAEIMGLLHAPG